MTCHPANANPVFAYRTRRRSRAGRLHSPLPMDARATTDQWPWAARAYLVLLALSALPALAAGGPSPAVPSGGHLAVAAEGRELMVLGPLAGGSAIAGPSAGQRESAEFAAQWHETDTRRIHVVRYNGKTYRKATPKAGVRSWIAFDPGSRSFRSLLPSIRVELDGDVQIDTVADALGAERVTPFASLGFAVFHTPADLHPVQAVQRVRELPGRPHAAVRLRAPRIEWR